MRAFAGTALVCGMFALALAGCQGDPTLDEVRKAVDRSVEEVYPSLVRIHVVVEAPRGGRILKFRASGSGAIISPEGYVVTNHHVAGDATRIICRMSTREEVEAELIGSDPMTDIAVLKLDLSTRKSRQDLAGEEIASFGDSDKVRVGDVVLAMGSPAGLSQSVTQGVVSNTEMIEPSGRGFSLQGEKVGLLVRWIGHDAQIFHGNSGGPLVNLKGQIIGVNEVGIGGLGGAIPSNLAASVVDQIIAGGEVRRSWTGLQVQPMLKERRGLEGVLVSGTIEDSPAAEAGFQAGDVITRYDGTQVSAGVQEELPLFHRVAMSVPVGKKIEVVALRDGREKVFELETIAREPARHKDVEVRSWGVTARDLTLMDAIFRDRGSKKGVIVNTLRSGGPATEAKPEIRPGDIVTALKGEEVSNVEDLQRISERILSGKTGRVPVLAAFDRGTRKFLTVVEIGEDPESPVTPTARKAWLSVDTQVLTRELAKALEMEDEKGVRVTMVYPGKGADEAGLEVGDIILKFDGETIDASQPEDTQVLPNMVRSYRIGTEVELTVIRDGQKKKIAVKLDAPPTPVAELDTYTNDDFEFSARDMSLDDKVSEKLEEQAGGVLVSEVKRAGWADLAGLSNGDVILSIDGEKTDSIKTLEKQLASAKEKRSPRVIMFIRRGPLTYFLELEPDWHEGAGA
jgi:serine protease Do